nr:protein SYM1-like [Ipomoea trifida]
MSALSTVTAHLLPAKSSTSEPNKPRTILPFNSALFCNQTTSSTASFTPTTAALSPIKAVAEDREVGTPESSEGDDVKGPTETKLEAIKTAIASILSDRDRFLNAAIVLGAGTIAITKLLTIDHEYWHGWTLYEVLRYAPEHNWNAYEEALKAHPVFAKMVISGIVYSMGDWIAQALFPFNDWWVVPAKVAFDQTVWSAVWNSIYYVVLGFLRFESPNNIFSELQATFWPMLTAGWKLWPFAHLITYGVVPVEQRLLWVDCVELVWVTILSTYSNEKSEARISEASAEAKPTLPSRKRDKGSISDTKSCNLNIEFQTAEILQIQPLLQSNSESIFPSKNKHTTAQSSILDVGYLVFHSRAADSTTVLAADDLEGAPDTISTTSSLLSTSHTYSGLRNSYSKRNGRREVQMGTFSAHPVPSQARAQLDGRREVQMGTFSAHPVPSQARAQLDA